MVSDKRPIRITNLSVKNLGPISGFQASLGDLNLFYGPNESGKTFLVEFIIHSLFSKTSYWKPLRELSAQGRVVVEGLKEGPVEFHLNQRGPRLDDLLERTATALSVSLARVLVVRAADVSIGRDGLSKDTVKEIFLPKRFFDTLQDRIQKVVRSASISEDGMIEIKRQGEGRQRHECIERLRQLNGCIERIQKELQSAELVELQLKRNNIKFQIEGQEKAKRYEAYRISTKIEDLKKELSEMPSEEEISKAKERVSFYFKNLKCLRDLENQLAGLRPFLKKEKELQAQIQQQVMAKKHFAYKVDREIDRLQKELMALPEEDLKELEITIREYLSEKERYESLKEEREQLERELSQLQWVPQAASKYYELQSHPPIHRPNILVPVIMILSFGMAIAGFILDNKALGSLMLLISGLGAGYYLWRLRKALDDYPRARELQVLEDRFRKVLGREAVASTDIEELKQQVVKKETLLREKDPEPLKASLKAKARSIKMLFERLKAEAGPEAKWLKDWQGLYERRSRLLTEKHSKERLLSSLQVRPTEYVSDPPEVEYDEDTLQRLQQEMEGVREKVSRYEHLHQEGQRLKGEIEEEEKSLSELIASFLGKEVEERNWEVALRELENRIKGLKNEVSSLEGLLVGLEIPPEEYVTQEPQTKYNREILNDLKEEERKIQELIAEKERDLEALKAQAVQQSGVDYSSDWSGLIEALYEKKEEVLAELRAVNARIVAGILVSQHLKKMQEEEDREIEGLLNSKELVDHLWSITRRYRGIHLRKEGFEIRDDFGAFSFSDLSTGAREQVLLALRLGMASRLSGHERMFIILDDAFQHVDWQKRPNVVQALVDMAKDGWQVIYLTMDDHIRDIFDKCGRSIGDRYRSFDLSKA